MNKDKKLKLTIADKISVFYLGIPFRDLKEKERIEVYKFCGWLIKKSRHYLKQKIKKQFKAK